MPDETSRIAAAAGGQLNGRTVGRRSASTPAKNLVQSSSIQDTLETSDRESNVRYHVQGSSSGDHQNETDEKDDSNESEPSLDITG